MYGYGSDDSPSYWEEIGKDIDEQVINCCECGQQIPAGELYEFTCGNEMMCGDCWFSEDALIDNVIEECIGEPGNDDDF